MCTVKDDEIAVPAIELWTSLAQEDQDRNLGGQATSLISHC